MRRVIALLLALASAAPLSGQAGNLVSASVLHIISYNTPDDQIPNLPVPSNQLWVIELRNVPDATAASVVDPRFDVLSTIPFLAFSPFDPTITPAGPGVTEYVWDFPGLVVEEPQLLLATGQETSAPVSVSPRVSLARSVSPLLLTTPTTDQIVTATFRLEEPLPADINDVAVGIGIARFVFGGFELVQTEIVSHSTVPGWNAFSDGAEVGWHASPEALQIGLTYTFQAVLRSVKSPELIGSPIFKPAVLVNYGRFVSGAPIVATATTVTTPDATVSATFSSGSPVEWLPTSGVPRYDFTLDPFVSQVTGPPPPFHVIVPATVVIKPETLNLKAQGVLTAFLQIQDPYDLDDVDLASINCEGAPLYSAHRSAKKLILKFRVQDLRNVPTGDSVRLTVSGLLTDGSTFQPFDEIRVID